jgi:hypothetical protein
MRSISPQLGHFLNAPISPEESEMKAPGRLRKNRGGRSKIVRAASDSSREAEQCVDGHVFVEIGPMKTFAAADHPPAAALFRRSVAKPGKPRQRRRNLASVSQNDRYRRVVERDVDGGRITPIG